MRRSAVAVALLACLTLLAGCGTSSTAKKTQVPAASGASAGANCWKPSQREQGGNSELAKHGQWSAPPTMTIDQNKQYTATLTTNKGDIEVEFFPKEAPQTVNNFVCLAEAGYYDNTPFHRIIAGFVIQGGDPTGTGTGGPGYTFPDEPVTRPYLPGTLAMANAGPNTNGSQFFIVLADLTGKLPPNYTIFGQVTKGMDVVNAIAQTPTKSSGPPMNEMSVPTQPVTLEKVTIHQG